MVDVCRVCERELPSRDLREHRQGRRREFCSPRCKALARWIREARANAQRSAERGFPQALGRVEATIARKLADVRTDAP